MQEYRAKLQENEKRNQEMGEMYKNGASLQEVAEAYDLSVTYTRAIMVRIGLYKPNKRRTKEEIHNELGGELFLTASMVKDHIIKAFPVGKMLRIKEYRIGFGKRTFVQYRYYKVVKHFEHCIQLVEMTKEASENGVVLVEKGAHMRTSPSYCSLYAMLRNGVKISE